MPETIYRQSGVVGNDGQLVINTPLSPGTPVEVMVITPGLDEFADLLAASSTSTDFWDNPLDDEDWNEAQPG